ncbi:hypothetical protein AX16_004165 [Volvariella volvacea WC 439]|nr:hypothetical protein AX16_004165 [Volvariella volvacea WC 439]
MPPFKSDVGLQVNIDEEFGMLLDAEVSQTKIDEEIARLNSRIIQLRRRRNALAPINQLPVEVFLQIMRKLPPDALPPPNTPKPPQSWVQFTHVCHQWRAVSLNDPLLWTNFHLPGMSLPWIETFIDRSKGAPLSVIIDPYSQSGASSLEKTFSTSTDTIKRVTNFYCSHRYLLRGSNDIADSVLLVSPLESLTMCNCEIMPNYDRAFNLRYLSLDCCRLDIAFISQSLRTLKLRYLKADSVPSTTGLYTLLSSLINLRHLVLDRVLSNAAAKEQPPFLPPGVFISSLLTLELIHEPEEECARFLSHLTSPHLTRLCIDIHEDPISLSLLNKELVKIWTRTRLLDNTNSQKSPRFTVLADGSHNAFLFYPYDFSGGVSTRIIWRSSVASFEGLLATLPQEMICTLEVVWNIPSDADFLVLLAYLSKLPSLQLLILGRNKPSWLYPVFLKSGMPSCDCIQNAGSSSDSSTGPNSSRTPCPSCRTFASSFFPQLRALAFHKAQNIADVDQQLLRDFLIHRAACSRSMDWVHVYCANFEETQEERALVQQLKDIGREFLGTDGTVVDILVKKA